MRGGVLAEEPGINRLVGVEKDDQVTERHANPVVP
jgi:hypothetical protein